jgi:DNA repair protein RecO (recombination protein O)
MGAEKTGALVLKILPYRESSSILYLFTEAHGLIHGIAKGIRRSKSRQDTLERGYGIELIVYNKPTRDLHTVSGIHVIEYFPSLRTNLVKSALRDAAFEMILAAITATDVHSELYEFFMKFLGYLDSSAAKECHPFALWLFCHRFARHMGFGLDVHHCIACGRELAEDAALSVNKGGLECVSCRKNIHERFTVPHAVITWLRHGSPKPRQLRAVLSPAELKTLTHLLTDYCRYHFDTQKEFKALAFLDEMAGW